MSDKDENVPEDELEFSARRREVVAIASLFSLALHGSLYLALSSQTKRSWPTEASSSALFGETFEIDTALRPDEVLPSAPAATGQLARPASDEDPASGAAAPGHSETSAGSPAREAAALRAEPEQPSRPRAPSQVVAAPKQAPSPVVSGDRGASPGAESVGAPAESRETGSAIYGQEGVARARASLFAAFVRTLPLAGKLLPGWLEAPIGQKQRVLVEVRVDASGRIHAVEIVRGDTKSILARTVLKNEAFLGRGVFAIQGEREGQMLIEIGSEVLERAPSDDEGAATRVIALGQRIPESPPGRPPTGAYFTYGSGRHIEFSVAPIELSR